MNFDENFDEIIDRKDTNCLKYDVLNERFGSDDLLPMWIADMDFYTPEPIVERLSCRMKHSLYGYAKVPEAFFDSIVNYYKRRGITLKSDNILFANGVVPSLSACVETFSDEQDNILIQSPIYPPFYEVIKYNKRQIVENELLLIDGQYAIDFEDVEPKIKASKVLLLCHPHNPSGRVFTKEELDKIIDWCIAYDTILVSDEIHSDIIYTPNAFQSILDFPKAKEIAVVLNAASKTYNIAGLSTSYIISHNPTLLKKLRVTLTKRYFDVPNIFGTIATITAYNECQAWLDALLVYLQNNRDFVIDYIAQNIPTIKAIVPQATYVIWLDLRACGECHDELKKRLIHSAKLALNSGVDFGGKAFKGERTPK